MELGIDFGTTYSTVCFDPQSGVDGCLLESRSPYIPTVVGFRADGTFSIGRAALAEEGLILYRDIKRWVGCNKINEHLYLQKLHPTYQVVVDEWDCSIGSVSHPMAPLKRVIDLVAIFLKGCLALLAETHPGDVRLCTCSVPADYNSYKRAFVFKACQSLKIGVQAVVNEPTAAAFSVMRDRSESKSEYLLVYDFGGGTFDVSLVLKSPGYMVVIDSLGDNYLGGRLVDEELQVRVASLLNVRSSDISSFSMEDLKITLSTRPDLELHDIGLLDKTLRSLIFKPVEFKELCSPIIDRTISLVTTVLTRNRVQSVQVVLIGGSVTLPGIREKLLNIPSVSGFVFAEETYRLAVAMGAARYAQTFTNTVRYRLVDCVAASLSDDRIPYKAHVILPKGHPTPCSVSYDFTMPTQNTALVLHEGESPNVLMNERCFSAALSTNVFPARSSGKMEISIGEDGRVSATFLGKHLENKLVVPDVSDFVSGLKFESLLSRQIIPNVREYQEIFGKMVGIGGIGGKSLRDREVLYRENGYAID
ncbi:ORF3 [Air potato virus 1]|uniref:ORF3 n=1 Tax=Air potato virus 1 TaxID=2491018 RepID=A0A3G6V9B9_9CLOS|nr:ORF3 [Air potato virus 1]AZB50209.1 ORF3 [Air potato virus 1]